MSRYGREANLDCKVYVGDLSRDASEKELERSFSYYGPLRNVWVARNPPGFAFLEFEDPRDADDAVRGLDGTTICGARVRVELSTGKVRPKPWMRSGGGGRDGGRDSREGGRGPPRMRKPFDPADRCYECGDRGHYAYDCSRHKRGGRKRSRSRSRSYERKRSHSHSRSRSRSRGRHKRSRSRSPQYGHRRNRSRSYSRSPVRYRRERSRSKSRGSRSRSRERFRTRSRSGSRSGSRGRSKSRDRSLSLKGSPSRNDGD